jgi:predicted DsbA family dithiol-disulfide isomerase
VRLDDVVSHFGEQVDVTWKSFLLRTEPKERSREEFASYSQGWTRMAELEPRANFSPWTDETPSQPPSSSLPAQVAAKIIQTNWPERFHDLHWALLTAYFTDNRTISDWTVLADIVEGVGVDRREFESILSEQRQAIAGQVIDDHNDAISQGITAVPTVLVNNTLPIPGAQETESYISWIERIIERQG